MTAKSTTISTEQEAWELVARWLQKQEIGEVEFKNWPVLRIHVEGEDYDSSLNSSQMSALVEFRKTIGRAYSAIAHGAYDMRRLKQEEEEQLEFSTSVSEGSSITDTDLTPLVQSLASITSNFPTATLVAGVVIGLLLVARPVILKHYENRAKEMDIEERRRLLDLSLTKEEQGQYRLFERALERLETIFPHFSRVMPDAAGGFWRFASASSNATQMTVAGIQLSQDDLELLSERRKKRPSDISEVEQVFSVMGVTKHQSAYRIQLSSPNLVLSAVYRHPQMTDARVKRLFSCMASGAPIWAKVEIKIVDKAQMQGRLIRFKPHQDDA
jgi:hypothetical protein